MPSQTSVDSNSSILVVEDNVANREVALGMLRRLGLRAYAVVDGAEAIAALSSAPFDLVLMDMRMPVMDGIEATRYIRDPACVLNHEIPIIAMTANVMRIDAENCLAAGMNDFMSKPVSVAALRKTLKEWLPTNSQETSATPSRPASSKVIESETVIFDPAACCRVSRETIILRRLSLHRFLTTPRARFRL